MYKAGDKVSVKATVESVMDDCVRIYAEGYGERSFNLEYAPIEQKTYEQGLADAWELAKKILDMKIDVAVEVFDCTRLVDVMYKFTPQEALAKIETYEKEKEIKVGDVVKGISAEGIVTRLSDDDTFYVMWKDGSSGRHDIKDLKKTGKHIDIGPLLRQIGE